MGEPQRQIYRFDGFQVDEPNRQLLREGQPVPLSKKAFDLLLVLLENNGRALTKNELLDKVWPDQFVEEVNLTVQIAALRKALCEHKENARYIHTIPKHGYRFAADFQRDEDAKLIIEHHTATRVVVTKEPNENGNSMAVVHGQPDSVQPSTGRVKRGRVMLAAGCAVIVLFAIGIGAWRYKSSQNNFAAIPFADAKIKQLTTKGRVHDAVLSPDGKFYAYTLFERGILKNSLWLGQTDGSRDVQLRPPDDHNLVHGLAFSPDGKSLYFALSKGRDSQGELFKMPVLGGVAEKLLDSVGSWFTLSPDGKQIAFYRKRGEQDASATLVIANLDGTGEREVLTLPRDRGFSTWAPPWSPDGSMLAVAANNADAKQSKEIFIVRAADGHLDPLTALEWSRVTNLIWLRDGQGLIACAMGKNENFHYLWHIDYPAGSVSRLLQDTDSYDCSLSFSADGNLLMAVQLYRESNIWIAPSDNLAEARQVTFSAINGYYGWHGIDWTSDGRIVFSAGVDDSIAIYSVDADGSNIGQITSAGFFDQRPIVTGDGRFILFQSNRSGEREIWRVNADGSDLRQLTTSGGNSTPDTTPDGKWVLYTSTRDNRRYIRRVSIDGGAESQITDKATSDDFRVSPDGKFIACGHTTEDDSPVQLAIISIEDGKLVKLFDVPRSANVSASLNWTPRLRWEPDGNAVCYRDWANGVWRQDINGGSPKRLEGLPEEKLYNFGWSRDGRLFAFARGREITDAVLIQNK